MELNNIEMQGGVLTPLKCSVQMDTLGADCLNSVEHSRILYKYKGVVKIPPLEFVDDILTVTDCSINSIKMNALVQSKVECKKLELSDTKCFKMHIGKDTINCPNLEVNGKPMQVARTEKYLGDVVSCSGKNEENIQMRHDKGMGIVNSIKSILKEISFGQHYFEIGMMLRTSMLVNGMLYNIESMNNLSTLQINQLEDCDKQFMRRLFDAEQETPVEAFYLETSAWPFRHILMGRKLMYFWTLLNKSETELVKSVFDAQCEFPSKGCWISEVKDILKSCKIYHTNEEIRKLSKINFKNLVKEKIQIKVMSYLVTLQNKHKKTENLHLESEMQKYLISSDISLTQKKFLFKLRSKMLKIKANFSSMHGDILTCSMCRGLDTTESEFHLLRYPFLQKNESLKNEMTKIEFSDVYLDISKQIKVVRVFTKIMDIYEKKKD